MLIDYSSILDNVNTSVADLKYIEIGSQTEVSLGAKQVKYTVRQTEYKIKWSRGL
jgi:hypothetical protein